MKRAIKNYEFFFLLMGLKIIGFYLMTDFNLIHIVLTIGLIMSVFQLSIYSGNKFIYKGFYIFYGIVSICMFLEAVCFREFGNSMSYQLVWIDKSILSISMIVSYIKFYHILLFSDLIIYYIYKKFFEKKGDYFICSPKSSKISFAIVTLYVALTIISKSYKTGEFFSYHIADFYTGIQNHQLACEDGNFLKFFVIE